MNNIKIFMVAGVVCLCHLAGCGGEEATPTKAVLFEEATPDIQATIDAAVQETRAAEVTDTPAPTGTVAPTDTQQATSTSEPTDTPEPRGTPEPTATPLPTNTPEPTDTPEPTGTPEPTDTPEPAATYTSAPASEGLHERLTGTWTSDIMTVTFDWENGTYSGVGLGELFNRKLALVSEDANTNVVVFKSDESTIVCQLLPDGSIVLRKQIEGGIPVILTRAP